MYCHFEQNRQKVCYSAVDKNLVTALHNAFHWFLIRLWLKNSCEKKTNPWIYFTK